MFLFSYEFVLFGQALGSDFEKNRSQLSHLDASAKPVLSSGEPDVCRTVNQAVQEAKDKYASHNLFCWEFQFLYFCLWRKIWLMCARRKEIISKLSAFLIFYGKYSNIHSNIYSCPFFRWSKISAQLAATESRFNRILLLWQQYESQYEQERKWIEVKEKETDKLIGEKGERESRLAIIEQCAVCGNNTNVPQPGLSFSKHLKSVTMVTYSRSKCVYQNIVF